MSPLLPRMKGYCYIKRTPLGVRYEWNLPLSRVSAEQARSIPCLIPPPPPARGGAAAVYLYLPSAHICRWGMTLVPSKTRATLTPDETTNHIPLSAP
jgi:hypothetical protein